MTRGLSDCLNRSLIVAKHKDASGAVGKTEICCDVSNKETLHFDSFRNLRLNSIFMMDRPNLSKGGQSCPELVLFLTISKTNQDGRATLFCLVDDQLTVRLIFRLTSKSSANFVSSYLCCKRMTLPRAAAEAHLPHQRKLNRFRNGNSSRKGNNTRDPGSPPSLTNRNLRLDQNAINQAFKGMLMYVRIVHDLIFEAVGRIIVVRIELDVHVWHRRSTWTI